MNNSFFPAIFILPFIISCMRREVRDWFEQAKHDLETARLLYKNKVYDSAAFYSFQSAEKALKALSYFFGYIPMKTHNLLELANMIKETDISIIDELKTLTPHYTVSRYPDAANGIPFEIYTDAISKDCISCAEKVLKWVEKIILKK